MKPLVKGSLIFYCLFGIVFSDGTQPPGSGTNGDPYLISTMQHLIWISTNPSSWSSDFLQTSNIDVIEIDDYDGGAGFRPIGDGYNGFFSGTYNGGGFAVDYLYIDRRSTSDVGMFGYINQATIQNLGITNPTIVGNSYVGVLIGKSENSEIINCYSSGAVAASVEGVGNYIGGLIGSNILSSVTNSYSTIMVKGGDSILGGLIGGNYSGSEVINCYSTGFVSNTDQYGAYLGGFVGENNNSTINCCYSTGSVTGSHAACGGFAGTNATGATISNCYSRGDVTQSYSSYQLTFGAFCGDNYWNASLIENCYSTGSVWYTSLADPTNKGFAGHDGGNSTTFSNNFWDSESSNQLTAIGATGLTSSDAQTFMAYIDAGWDFIGETVNGTNDYWNIDYSALGINKTNSVFNTNAINDGYPFFSWQSSAIPEIKIFVNGDEFYNGEGYDFGSFVLPGQTYDVDVIVENTGTADLYLFPLPEIVTPYTNYFEFVTQPTSPVPPSGNTEFTVRLTIPGGFPKTAQDIFSTSIDIPNNDIDESPFRILLGAGIYIEMDIEDEIGVLPTEFTVLDAFPNPFNPSTTITYGLNMDSQVSIAIYDVTGKLITNLLNMEQTLGWHSTIWNGKDNKNNQVPAGIYLGKVTSNNTTKTTKLMFLK